MRVRRRIYWKEKKTGFGYKKLKLQTTIYFWEKSSQVNEDHPSQASVEVLQVYRNCQAESQHFLHAQVLLGDMQAWHGHRGA